MWILTGAAAPGKGQVSEACFVAASVHLLCFVHVEVHALAGEHAGAKVGV